MVLRFAEPMKIAHSDGRRRFPGSRRVSRGRAERMVTENLSKAAALRAILGGVSRREQHPEDTLAQAEVTRHEGKRARILEQREDGLISRETCNARIRSIDQELSSGARRATNW